MELIINDLVYKSDKEMHSFNNVNYTFKNSITFVSGISASIIKSILFQEVKVNHGYICLDSNGKIYDISYLSNNPIFNKDNLYEEVKFLNSLYGLKYKDIEERLNNALKMVNLYPNFMNINFNDMSLTELKKSSLVLSMYLNSKILIFDYFEKGMSNNDIEYLKKLVNKLNKMYNKNIIICSNNIDCFLNIIKDIVIFKDGSIVFNGSKSDLYNDDLYKYIDEPIIINFIKYLDSKGHKFDHYIDIKELLKAIYRDVENK